MLNDPKTERLLDPDAECITPTGDLSWRIGTGVGHRRVHAVGSSPVRALAAEVCERQGEVVIIAFLRDDTQGAVTVTLDCVDDPAVIGKPPSAHGFPCCTAVVDYPGKGYRSLFGWVQLVRSTDNSSAGAAFDMDPF
ncbi:hypothetical protein [Wenjunlia tyrosinilytica]|uniref:hypothetical protein n=1 Tax=Wenjunlia tyrosinilytica TaxID=1544741 RepID=UPI00166A2A64|nr:hypothetical protein [Wenjunlia tyrosinilytica]